MAQKMLDSQFNYWQYMISTYHNIFEEQFLKSGINNDSLIVHVEIYDEDKGILKSGWSAHKNTDSTIGFIKHVVIPSAYYTFLDRNSDGFFIPLSSFDIVVKEVMNLVDVGDHETFETNKYFNILHNQLTTIHSDTSANKNKTLQLLTEQVNAKWINNRRQKLSIKVFCNPSEIADYIASDEFCEFEKVVEEMVTMSLSDFKDYCNQVVTHPFINRSFISRLNHQIPYLTI